MSETPGKYYIEDPNDRAEAIAVAEYLEAKNSYLTKKCQAVRSPYFIQVAVFAEAFVTAGTTEIEDIVDNAVALTNKLIEKIEEEKSNT